ncbi:MAG: AEC family transporter, partial [Clostridia bacterium]|nr:AEC family transporter [Clostridia bacterium]
LNAFDIDLTGEVAGGFLLAVGAAVMIHILLLLFDKVYTRIVPADSVERGSILYSNSGNLIIPIVTFVLGEEWVIYSLAFLSVQIVFIWTHGIGLFSDEKKTQWKKILLNVNLITVLVGAVMMLCHLRLPTFVKSITSSFSDMLGPISMLIAGMLAAKLDYKRVLGNKRLYLVTVLRTVVCPLLVLGAIKLFTALVSIPNADKILLISFLAAITPSASTIMQFAQIKGKDAEYAAAINIVTTLICIVTMPLFVAFYNGI